MVDEEYIKNLYKSDRYLKDNPLLFDIDTRFKFKNIIPLVDVFVENIDKKEINLLDVGGGRGILLKEISDYIKYKHNINVNKFILDLSPGMIKIQQEVNPDIKKSLNEDICKTSLSDNEIDLTLMIDVLEHVVDPIMALKELKRISKFVIFKVPIEDNLAVNLTDFILRGKYREKLEEGGHVNSYSFKKLENQIETYYGDIKNFYFCNVFKEVSERGKGSSEKDVNPIKLIFYFILSKVFYISPKLSSLILTDYIMILT